MSVDILSFNTSLTKAYSLAATVTRQKIEIEKKFVHGFLKSRTQQVQKKRTTLIIHCSENLYQLPITKVNKATVLCQKTNKQTNKQSQTWYSKETFANEFLYEIVSSRMRLDRGFETL